MHYSPKTKNPPDEHSPPSRKEVFVSRVKFPVSLTKASQGDSLAAFLASIQEILYSYETAKHFKMK
ncbi:MAG: hypothetical protein IKL41_02345, partial [Clostridia bacterium]|nr:hypothetical protein [Clostridia bacterium]